MRKARWEAAEETDEQGQNREFGTGVGTAVRVSVEAIYPGAGASASQGIRSAPARASREPDGS